MTYAADLGLLITLRGFDGNVRVKSPRYAALTQPQPLSVKEIQQQVLDEETLLLEFALGEEHSYLWAVTPTSIQSYELPKRVEIEAEARRVYEALTARNKLVRFEKQEDKQARAAQADSEYYSAAARLSETLLGPLVGQLGRKRLLIVSDGALQYLPFGALPVPLAQGPGIRGQESGTNKHKAFQPLILNHEIVSLPSASALAVLRKELVGRQRGAKTLAVLADPVFESTDPRVKWDQTKTGEQADKQSKKSSETRGLDTEIDALAAGLQLVRIVGVDHRHFAIDLDFGFGQLELDQLAAAPRLVERREFLN